MLITALGAAQIISTYGILSQTWDEPIHIAAGMEWLQHGSYNFEGLHPPLARVAVAMGLFLTDKRLNDQELSWRNLYREGNDLIHAGGTYLRNLALARLGVVPFFFLAAFMVWSWTRMLFGTNAALAATTLFANLPPILAHSGLATTDLPSASLIFSALFAFTLWLDKPTLFRSLVLGSAVALSVLSKFSALAFLPTCMLAVCALRYAAEKRAGMATVLDHNRWIVGVSVGATIAVLLIWGGYRFSVGSLRSFEERPHEYIDQIVGNAGYLRGMTYSVLEAPVFPAPELFRGVFSLMNMNMQGRGTFFMGELTGSGVWYYFPTVLALKTPIPFIVFAVVGFICLCRLVFPLSNWRPVVPVILAATLLAVGCLSNINLGVRHLLAIYPVLAVMSGFGAATLWKFNYLRLGPLTVIVLLMWQVALSLRSQPDFLAYFNEFARGKPEQLIVDSDLDWGQDLKRLSDVLKYRKIDQVTIAYYGSADLERHDLPHTQSLVPYQISEGWIAISLSLLKMNKGFHWLEAYEPVAQVGKSIRLYYISGVGSPCESDWRKGGF